MSVLVRLKGSSSASFLKLSGIEESVTIQMDGDLLETYRITPAPRGRGLTGARAE